MRYEVLDGQSVVNTIIATPEFMSAQYPAGNYRLLPEPPVEVFPMVLNRVEFEAHVQSSANLTDEEFLSLLNDSALALTWHRIGVAKELSKGSDLVNASLSAMVSAGHLTSDQVGVVNQSWPTKPE